jgi:hypothetical protein
MKYINIVKRKAGEFFLEKELKIFIRNRGFKGFESAQSIGVIFNASNNDDFDLVKKYVKYLRESQKRVKALGYFNLKEVPEMKYSKIEYDFFANKDLNWHLQPACEQAQKFINEEYDILIDLNLDDDFPLKYISSLSKAKFKIGKYLDNNITYDLMIAVEENKGIKYFLKHLDHYLMQMNPVSDKK